MKLAELPTLFSSMLLIRSLPPPKFPREGAMGVDENVLATFDLNVPGAFYHQVLKKFKTNTCDAKNCSA